MPRANNSIFVWATIEGDNHGSIDAWCTPLPRRPTGRVTPRLRIIDQVGTARRVEQSLHPHSSALPDRIQAWHSDWRDSHLKDFRAAPEQSGLALLRNRRLKVCDRTARDTERTAARSGASLRSIPFRLHTQDPNSFQTRAGDGDGRASITPLFEGGSA